MTKPKDQPDEAASEETAPEPDVSQADATGIEGDQAVQDVTSTGDASETSIPADQAPADPSQTVPEGGTSTIDGVSAEDAPHAVVDDSVGQAQTAAYAEATAAAEGPTGEEPVADVDGTVVPQGAMPANGVWPAGTGGETLETTEGAAAEAATDQDEAASQEGAAQS